MTENIVNITEEYTKTKICHIISKIHESSIESLTSDGDFKIMWQNLNFRIASYFQKGTEKKILNNLSGYMSSGEVMAILGPSGAGKSTLLACLCGRKTKGLSGELKISGLKDVVIGYVPQTDYLLDNLKARESIIFASHFRSINNNEENPDHDKRADKIMEQFGLTSVSNTKAYRLSGGQRRRLSIALEVLAKPNILVLDEPTTGLDIPSCAQVINIMLELASDINQRIAIICTVHQPSVRIFNSFHRIYILSHDGRCVYNGLPMDLITTLSEFDLNCPEFTSPVDYIIEIASGDYGAQAIASLEVTARQSYIQEIEFTDKFKTLSSTLSRNSNQFWAKMFLLLKRSQIILYRDWSMAVIRVIMVLLTAVFLGLIFGNKVGHTSGCFPSEYEIWVTPVAILLTKFEDDYYLINENLCLICLSLVVALLSGLTPALLNFPREVLVFSKEYHNQWYSCISYYIARVISDLPIQLILPAIYWAIIYSLTGQPMEFSRVCKVFLVTLLLSFCAQSIGETVSAIWLDKPGVATFVGMMVQLPILLFGGFFVRIYKIPVYLQWISYFSVIRFSFEAILVSLYGFDRCHYQCVEFVNSINITAVTKPDWVRYLPIILSYMDQNSEQEVSDIDRLSKLFGRSMVKGNDKFSTSDSLVIGFFDVNDHYFYRAIAILFAYVFVFKVSTYYVLLAKLKSQIS